jgi:hypothetical protein
MGLLLPISNITAKELIIKRTVDVYSEEDIIAITSDANSGSLTTVKVYNSSKVKVIEESCSGYYHEIDASSLPNGLYSVVVFTTLTTYSENIYL